MNRAAFRRFEFFETEVIAKDILHQFSANPTCAIAESGMLLFGDEDGNVTITDRDFHSTDRRYKLFNGSVIGLSYIFDKTNNNRQFIIALGDDSRPVETGDGTVANPTPIFVVKILNTIDMARTLYKLNATITDGYITAFAVHHDGTEIAIGYNTGKILLYTGFFLKENSQQRPNTTPQVILPSHFVPVSALYFCEIGLGYGEDRKVKLFAVFETKETSPEEDTKVQPAIDSLIEQEDIQHAGIIVFDTSISVNSAKGTVIYAPREDPKALDAKGSTYLCASYMKHTSELVIARNEAIYTYTIEDRGGALAIFGDKQSMVTVGRYILVVSTDEKPSTTGSEANSAASNKANKSIVTIYDLKNKFICGTSKKYYLPANEKVAYIFSDEGIGYLLTSNWNLIRFREKDVNRKLDVLLTQVKPPMFPLAITLAGEEQLDAQEIMKLYKLYGDHLYNKHEFDSAVTQYCYTIGYVPPSYVIVKFLDSYRVKNLITYLEKLKDKGLAAMDHVTLLLNCYVKIKDESKLKDLLEYIFVNTMKLRSKEVVIDKSNNRVVSTFTNTNLNQTQYLIDPEQAILILSNAGFEEQALKVAVVYMQHSAYMKIQLSKTSAKFDEALGYLAYMAFTCHPSEVIQILQLHGKQLLTARPKQYTTLLLRLCINDLESIINLPVPPPSSSTTTASSSKKGDGNLWSNDFLTSLQYFLKTNHIMTPENISPEELIKFFYSDEMQLLNFLEGIVNASRGRVLHAKIWTTYLELNMKKYHYTFIEKFKSSKQLSSASNASSTSTTAIKTKLQELEYTLSQLESLMMGILDGPNVHYDPAHVLLLCSMFQFQKGERYLLDRQQSIDLLLKKLIENNETKEVFKLLRKEGTKEPELFIQVLTYLVQRTIQQPPSTGTLPTKTAKGTNQKKGEKESGNVRSLSKDRSIQIDSDDDDDSEENGGGRRKGATEDDEDDEDNEDGGDNDAKWDAIIDVVELIEKESILSPIQVLEILALNPNLPLKVVSNYVNNVFAEVKEQVTQVTNDVKTAVVNLQSISFTANAENQLKAKSKRALARAQRKRLGYEEYDDEDEEEELEDEKAQELLENEKWKSILRNQKNAAQEHENFYKELELSTDGFTTVANYIGKTIIF